MCLLFLNRCRECFAACVVLLSFFSEGKALNHCWWKVARAHRKEGLPQLQSQWAMDSYLHIKKKAACVYLCVCLCLCVCVCVCVCVNLCVSAETRREWHKTVQRLLASVHVWWLMDPSFFAKAAAGAGAVKTCGAESVIITGRIRKG